MSNGADTFYTSDKVTVQKVSFRNQFQMKIAGNLFVPRNLDHNARHPASISDLINRFLPQFTSFGQHL